MLAKGIGHLVETNPFVHIFWKKRWWLMLNDSAHNNNLGLEWDRHNACSNVLVYIRMNGMFAAVMMPHPAQRYVVASASCLMQKGCTVAMRLRTFLLDGSDCNGAMVKGRK